MDLRGKLRMLRITLRDESGSPWKDRSAAAWSTTAVGSGVAVGSTTDDDELLMLVAGTVDLHVAAEGFEPVLLEVVTADTTVPLRRLRTVSIRVPAVTPPPGMKLLLVVAAHGLPIDKISGRKGPWTIGVSQGACPPQRVMELGKARTVSVAVRQEDGCDVRVVLDHKGKWTDVEGIRPARIQLGLDRVREWSLEIPAAAIEVAARKARGR